jgi:hypothetical protein
MHRGPLRVVAYGDGMFAPERAAQVALGIAMLVAPVVAILNRIVVGSELRAEAPRSLRQIFFLRADELTPWGVRARRWFRIYWLAVAGGLAAEICWIVIS